MKRTPKVIIVGAGLGGLECGYLLSQHGMDVCVLEQGAQVGGCLQSFRRHGLQFDTGFHYVGGMGEGEILHQLFSEFRLTGLPWVKLDTECFDEVFLDGEHYAFANGYDRFADELSKKFPQQRPHIAEYVNMLRRSQSALLSQGGAADSTSETLLATSAYQYLQECIPDERLRKVLSATSLKMDLRTDTLPLYIFAQINGTFVQSAWRLRGGGQLIADTIADGIRTHGGQVRTRTRVTGIHVNEGSIDHVILNDNEMIPCDLVISDIHPNALFPLLEEGSLRKRYVQRISSLENSFGVFTVQLLLKEGAVRYRNRNIFVHNHAKIWHSETWDARQNGTSIGVHFAVPTDGSEYTRNIDLFMPMSWQEVAPWAGTRPMQRGNDYDEFKQRNAEVAISAVLPYIPDIQGNIEKIIVSTPLTYRDYTHTFEGSAYGICKDYDHLISTMLPIRTPIPNLFLTGQNVNFHGVLGVTVTAKMTCGQVISALPMLS